jgi:hypothetical protein
MCRIGLPWTIFAARVHQWSASARPGRPAGRIRRLEAMVGDVSVQLAGQLAHRPDCDRFNQCIILFCLKIAQIPIISRWYAVIMLIIFF